MGEVLCNGIFINTILDDIQRKSQDSVEKIWGVCMGGCVWVWVSESVCVCVCGLCVCEYVCYQQTSRMQPPTHSVSTLLSLKS